MSQIAKPTSLYCDEMIPSRDPWQRRTISLEVDLQCIHCNYNLRGLAISSACPECGRPVWDSLLNRSMPAFYSAARTASVLCAVTAAIPVLVAFVIAIGSSRNPVEALVVTLALTTIALAAAGPGWFALAVEELRPTSGESLAILIVAGLSIIGVIASALLTQLLPALYAEWAPRAWDATLTALCAYLMLAIGPAARFMFVIRRPILARLLQAAQIMCLFAGTACLGSLALELTHDAEWFRPIAWRSAAIAGVCLLLVSSAASYRAVGASTGHG